MTLDDLYTIAVRALLAILVAGLCAGCFLRCRAIDPKGPCMGAPLCVPEPDAGPEHYEPHRRECLP